LATRQAAAAGLVLDGWQSDVLDGALGIRDDGKWAAFHVGLVVSRQNGKGSVLEARVLAGLLLFGESLQMWTAHEMKTASEAFLRVEALFDSCADLRKRVKRVIHANGKEAIELRNGARLRFVARSRGSGRGFSGDLVIMDEWYAGTSEHVDALLPTMSARTMATPSGPQIWYTSSPPLTSDTGVPLFRLRSQALTGAPRVAYFDFGAAGNLDNLDAVDLDDRGLWAASNPALGTRISEEFISDERTAMTDEGFARERLGIWPAEPSEGWQVITAEAWAARLDEASERPSNVAIAVDVTPDRKWSTIAVAGERDSGGVHLEVLDHEPGTGWVAARVRELVETWEPCAVVLDAAGPAGSLIAALEAADVDLVLPSARETAQACGQFFDGVCGTSPSMWHTGSALLSTALAGAQTRPLSDAWAWARKTTEVDISPLVAVTLAAWGFEVHGRDSVPLVAWR
jgi:phage terminase large subunit-like protein